MRFQILPLLSFAKTLHTVFVVFLQRLTLFSTYLFHKFEKFTTKGDVAE
jgi:hypothetical protein